MNPELSTGDTFPQLPVQTVVPQAELTGRISDDSTRGDFTGPDAENAKIRAEASRRSIDFQLRQYREYIRKVRESGIEPKRLLTGLDIPQSGPDAPSFEFWCLITVRDRIIVESTALIGQIRLERRAAMKSFGISSSVILVLAFGVNLSRTRWAGFFNFSALSYSLMRVAKLAAAWRGEDEIKSILEKVMNWELE